jgi:hypothetical protein
MIDLNERAKEVHAANAKWWHDLETGERIERNKGELLMLVVSEIAEAMEGERKNLMDDHLPHRKMAEVEMADAYIRLLDYAAGFGVDLRFLNKKGEVVENKGESLLYIVDTVTAIDYDADNINWAISEIQDYCHAHNYDLEGAYQEKMAYNATRKDHSVEERRKENGKKF